VGYIVTCSGGSTLNHTHTGRETKRKRSSVDGASASRAPLPIIESK